MQQLRDQVSQQEEAVKVSTAYHQTSCDYAVLVCIRPGRGDGTTETTPTIKRPTAGGTTIKSSGELRNQMENSKVWYGHVNR